jgi:thiosulfate/3-mercaptopyruvate sulfurtransferase
VLLLSPVPHLVSVLQLTLHRPREGKQALVDTAWVAEHAGDAHVRIVESDEDILLYDQGHIPGAVKIDWVGDLQDKVGRDYINQAQFEALMVRNGIANKTTVVFYGDKNNWWACYAFWVFKLFGHQKCLIMNGGRKKWIEEGRPLSREIPRPAATTYKASTPNLAIRAFRDEVLARIGKVALVDVRSPGEYAGELLHMADYPQEGALRGGHIPTAKNIPWGRAVTDRGVFKSPDELKELYAGQGITPDQPVIAYCRIGERSSLTWYVLTYLLGYPDVKNYDGSWTEWGNLVGVPIER